MLIDLDDDTVKRLTGHLADLRALPIGEADVDYHQVLVDILAALLGWQIDAPEPEELDLDGEDPTF